VASKRHPWLGEKQRVPERAQDELNQGGNQYRQMIELMEMVHLRDLAEGKNFAFNGSKAQQIMGILPFGPKGRVVDSAADWNTMSSRIAEAALSPEFETRCRTLRAIKQILRSPPPSRRTFGAPFAQNDSRKFVRNIRSEH
jgi:hypothetical protein